MGGWSRRLAQRGAMAATAVILMMPGAAQAIAPGGPVGARPLLDRRDAPAPGARQAPARVRDARAALRRRFGAQLALGVDEATGATRVVQRLDGALTGPAEGDRAEISRAWLRDNRAVLGLDAEAVDALAVSERSTAGASGLTTVRFDQRFRGVEVFDGGVEVTLDRGGRVLSAVGAPVPDPAVPSTAPRLDADAARRALAGTVGTTQPVAPAELTLFAAPSGTALAWRLLERRSSAETYAAVVDATSGAVLYRQDLTKGAAPSTVYPNYPGASGNGAPGGKNAAVPTDLEAAGYLPAGATKLDGQYAYAYSDLDDDDTIDAVNEDVFRDSVVGFNFPFAQSTAPCPATTLAPTPMCSWNPVTRNSWFGNRRQTTVQAFWLVNRFRQHLDRPEIGFGAKGFSGATGRVVVQTLDGANTDGPAGRPDLPDRHHVNNANMTVLPQPYGPTMQMYLFESTKRSATGAPTTTPSGYRPIDGGDDAATVWHEYTHGLSGRLVTHPDGTSALASAHGGALGEGWSDFYALDLLHRDGLEVDDAAPGDVDIGAYSDSTLRTTRSQAADCSVGAAASACPGGRAKTGSGPVTGAGGYTLGDFGKVLGRPEVHYDGEIWLETLWDLRRALVAELGSEVAGSDAVERLVTDGMRLTPPEPTFLDARNAILTADTAAGGTYRELIWGVFARRGMGFYAAVNGPNDPAPVESFVAPPARSAAPWPMGRITGRVTDNPGRLPLRGVQVTTTDPSGAAVPAVTGADGTYALDVPAGPAPRLRFDGPAGYEPTVVPGAGAVLEDEDTPVDVSLRRDWTSAAGGAKLDPPQPGFCGPGQLLDETEGSGWSAYRGSSAPSVIIELPAPVNVSGIWVNPAATCGSAAGAAVSSLRIEAVNDTGTVTLLTTSISGTTPRLLRPAGNATGVTRLRVTLLAPTDPSSSYVDLSELAVYGANNADPPRGTLTAAGNTVPVGTAVRFDASFTDADAEIGGYDWDFDGNGTVDQTTNSAGTEFTYAAPGSFTARVSVRDAGGVTGTATAPVQVNPPAGTQLPATTPIPAPPPAPVPDPPAPPSTTPTTTIRPAPPGAAPILRIAPSGRRAASASVKCASRCSIRATGTVSAATARRLGRSRRTVLVTTLSRTGTAALTLPLTRTAMSAARRRGVRSLLVAVQLHATDTARRSASRRATVRIAL